MDLLKNEFNKQDQDIARQHRSTVLTRKNPKISLEEIENSQQSLDKNINIKNNIKFLKIDEKSSFEPQTEEFKEFIENCFNDKNKALKTINMITNKLFNKACGTNTNYNDDIISISQNISKVINKIVKIDKDYVDELIFDFVGASNFNLYKSDCLLLDIEACDKIGSMLCYCYSGGGITSKIKDVKKLRETRQTILKSGINVYKDYTDYCKHNKQTDLKITLFWKKNKSKYPCLPELIFLFNRFAKVKEIEFDINAFLKFEDTDLKEAHHLFMLLTLININIIVNSLNKYKINLIYEEFEQILYFKYYYNKFNLVCKQKNDIFKKNNAYNKNKQFNQKWNFKYSLDINDDSNTNANKNKKNIKSLSFNNDDKSLGEEEEEELSFENNNEEISNNLIENKFNKLIEKYLDRLELIIVVFFGLSNFDNYENLELTFIINDAFIQEYSNLLSNFYSIDRISISKDCFEIIDLLIYNKKNSLKKKLNLEINSLDETSFHKYLTFILKNRLLISLNISLFSSDFIYFPQSLYKISIGNMKNNEVSDSETTNYLYDDVNDLEKKILNKLSANFIYHLSVFFEILSKYMENLEELGINIDTPPNLLSLQNYKNSILKFVFNLLYFISSNGKIKRFCLISPNSILDSRKMPHINELFKTNEMTPASNLIDLTLNLQFVRILNIGQLISTQLQILNIGYFDLETFKKFCQFLCSDKFNRESCLKKISIGVSNIIINFDFELKIIFRKLFSVKIKSLISLSLYTNIIIKDEIEYDYLLKILNNNWINEYLIALNPKSNKCLENFSNETLNFNYFVPHSLEDKLLNPEDVYNYQKHPAYLELGENLDKNDDAYWYLKYLFEKRYFNELSNDNAVKKYIKGILKYLYFQKIPKIKFYTDSFFKNY